MRLLLGSGGFRTDERIPFLRGELRRLFGDRRRLLFVPWALADHDAYETTLRETGLDAGYELVGIHRHADPMRAVREAEGIYVGGGNTFRLVDALHRNGVIETIRERAREGVPYFGVSAGANVACPTMMTTNDMPIVLPPSFAALNLVPFQINPHYYAGSSWLRNGDELIEHFGETRDDRIREYHEMNSTPVIGIVEGSALRVEDGTVELVGGDGRVFRRGEQPVDVAAGTRLDGELVPVE
jgi:dipeptidase E